MPDHNTVPDATLPQGAAPATSADAPLVAHGGDAVPDAPAPVLADVIPPAPAPDVSGAETAVSDSVVAAAPVSNAIDADARGKLFEEARTSYAWTPRPVGDDVLRAVFDTMRMAPTSANSSPARFVFLRTTDARERLRPTLSAGNVERTMSAPVVAIVAYDPHFYDHLGRLCPGAADARSWFSGNPDFAAETAWRNATLQGGYFILAARAHGLDCGPMSGFDNARVDALFLSDRGWKSNFLVNLGYGDPAGLRPRAPRLGFDEACVLL